MSRFHKVIVGDRITNISVKYYGTASKTGLIVSANPQLKGRPNSLENLPTIYAGDSLIIPDETINIVNFPEKKLFPETIPVEKRDSISFLIEGEIYSFFSGYNINQSFDTLDTIGFTIPDDDISGFNDVVADSFGYKDIGIYYDGNLIFGGTMLAPSSSSEPDSKIITVSCYPKCGVLNDCVTPDSLYPIHFENQNIQQIANKLLEPFGLQAVFTENIGNVFPRVAPEIEQKILAFLVVLAKQRGVYTTNTPQGNLLFWKANTEGESVANIKEGSRPFISCAPKFNPQQYYSHITGFLPMRKNQDSDKYTWENPFLKEKGILRPHAFVIKDSESSDVRSIVEFFAGRMFGNVCSYNLQLQGHRDEVGNLYTKNTLINVLAPGARIFKDTQFLIKSLSLSRTSDGGDLTNMNLVLPGSYSGVLPEVVPWES